MGNINMNLSKAIEMLVRMKLPTQKINEFKECVDAFLGMQNYIIKKYGFTKEEIDVIYHNFARRYIDAETEKLGFETIMNEQLLQKAIMKISCESVKVFALKYDYDFDASVHLERCAFDIMKLIIELSDKTIDDGKE
jgi:hypothetical protein